MDTKSRNQPQVDPKEAEREQMAAAHPESWIPVRAGDTVTGTMIDLDIVWSDVKGREYPLVTLQLEDGSEKRIHCMSAALEGEVMRKRPVPGEVLTFSYHGQGEAPRPGRSGAHIYRLRIKGRTPEAVGGMYDRLAGVSRPANGGGGGAAPPAQPAAPAAPGGDDEDIPF